MEKKINHTDTREKILREARYLFASRGFDATSMEDIAARVGIKKPSLYYFFKNKEQIFEKVMEDVFDRLDRDLAAIASSGKNNAELFRNIVVRSIKAGKEGSMAASAHFGNRNGNMHASFRKKTSELKHRLEKFLKKSSVPRPLLAAQVIFNAIQAYIFHSQYEPPPVSPETYASYLGSIFIPSKK
jgi:AcrR family transcriptional regulator